MLIAIKLISIFLFSTLVSVFFSINIPINFLVIIDSLIHDWIYFSPVLFIIYSIGFFIAFLSSKVVLLLFSWEKRIVYGIAGACAVAAILYLSVALLFETQVIAGNRYTLGWIFHIIFGFFGGYIFASFLKKI